jgi:hypothetical protein
MAGSKDTPAVVPDCTERRLLSRAPSFYARRMVLTMSDHEVIVNAGWAYRTNERGWVIYRDPQTRQWHTRTEALAIIGELRMECSA